MGVTGEGDDLGPRKHKKHKKEKTEGRPIMKYPQLFKGRRMQPRRTECLVVVPYLPHNLFY